MTRDTFAQRLATFDAGYDMVVKTNEDYQAKRDAIDAIMVDVPTFIDLDTVPPRFRDQEPRGFRGIWIAQSAHFRRRWERLSSFEQTRLMDEAEWKYYGG